MKISIFVIGVALCACLIASTFAHDVNHNDDDDDDDHRHHHRHHHRHSTHASRIHVKSFHGKRYPPSPRDTETADKETPELATPIGKPRGPISPSSPAVDLTMLQLDNANTNPPSRRLFAAPGSTKTECGGTSVNFNRSSPFGSGGFPATEPSGAKAGKIIFATGNWFAAVSIDDGVTFHHLEPTAYSGPADLATSGSFCCDQVVHYIPKIDRFVWLMQFNANNKKNKLRIVSFHPRDVDTGGINAWIYLDLFSTQFNLADGMDYGDLAVGDNFLYVSIDGAGNLLVIRIPIPGLNVVAPLTVWYTDPARGDIARFSHVSQNPGDTVFWAGHTKLGTTMRIFKWPESGTTYYWSDIRINDWPSDNANFIAPCPGNSTTNWIIDAQFHDIIGVTRRSKNEVWFSWPAPSGGGFPHVHVQVVQIDPSRWPTLRLIKQWQIWNPDFAFGYPSLYTNECGDVGVAVGFGGGNFSPSSAVGIADSSGILGRTVWYPELSDVCENRWGDYLTVRQGDGNYYAAFVYAQSSTTSGILRNARYLQFGKA